MDPPEPMGAGTRPAPAIDPAIAPAIAPTRRAGGRAAAATAFLAAGLLLWTAAAQGRTLPEGGPAPGPTQGGPAQGGAAQDGAARPDAPALFREHCASCHGETGDGKGWTELDRPARSFQDGGFSFGNTPETIARTIAGGIPGTPMPGFDAALSATQIAALARHVIALGPPELPAPERTEMIVLDRPLVARGLLPPIVRGAPERPRGLLLGTLDGLTFEYDAADLRLVGVRQGRFVDRRDWGDRGGSALKPLGQVVYPVEGGKPRAPFALLGPDGSQVPLVQRLAGTRVLDGRASVLSTLLGADGRNLARVVQSPARIHAEQGSGFVLRYRIEPLAQARLVLRLPGTEDPSQTRSLRRLHSQGPGGPPEGISALLRSTPAQGELLGLRHDPLAFPEGIGALEDGGHAILELVPGRPLAFDLLLILFSPDVDPPVAEGVWPELREG